MIRKGGFVLLGLVLIITGCSKKEQEKESIRPVFYQKISSTGGVNKIVLPGVIQYNQESKLSFRVGGVLKSIPVVVGENIKKGELLAVIDDTDYLVSYKQAMASYQAVESSAKNAKAQLNNAKSNFLRIEQLYINNNTSLSEFEKAKAQLENAKSGLQSAISQSEASRAQLNATKNQLNYTKLVSPVDGTISKILFEENESIGIGKPIMILASDNNFEVRALVTEQWINQLQLNQEVEVVIGSLNETLTGVIKEISPDAPGNSGYPIKISFDKNTTALKAGMSVKVHINKIVEADADEPIIVDTDAVQNDAEGFFVYVLEEKENELYAAKRRNIEVGELLKNGYVVHKGLENDELVVTAGVRFLYDGKIVKLQEQKAQ